MKPANILWTKTSFAKVPALYSTEKQGDEAMCYVKFFCVLNDWRWYVLEYDPETGRAFGLVQGHDTELGYFMVTGSLEDDAMQANNENWRKMGYPFPPFERDLHFIPRTIGEIKKTLETGCPA